jgi:hypothetical protein
MRMNSTMRRRASKPCQGSTVGLYQYVKAQRWKRREFIAAQIKDFEADKKIQLAMTMLDWNERTLTFPTETGERKRLVNRSS